MITTEANLASTNREKQRVAARCVGDLVGKLGGQLWHGPWADMGFDQGISKTMGFNNKMVIDGLVLDD